MPIEHHRNGTCVSTETSRLDLELIHKFLSESSYWAQGRSRETVLTSTEQSLCFGVFHGDRQVGFARVVTDYATFAWLCDVFVVPSHRGLGLGKWLVGCVVSHPGLQGLTGFLLATRDAHALYRRYGGFVPLYSPEKWMIRARTRQEAPVP